LSTSLNGDDESVPTNASASESTSMQRSVQRRISLSRRSRACSNNSAACSRAIRSDICACARAVRAVISNAATASTAAATCPIAAAAAII
jgi:hypothetical protein